MKALFTIALLTLTLNAKADGFKLTPIVPVDCQQSEPREVSFISGNYATPGSDSSIILEITWGSCQKGLKNLKPIAENYNVYIVSDEYSSDFNTTTTSDGKSIQLTMNLKPEVFFAQYDKRHFHLSYYPAPGSFSFNYDMLFFRDPVTGKVRLIMNQR